MFTLDPSRIYFFDGAMGSMLQARGLKLREIPEILNLTQPDLIRSIHREYLNAGSDFITANTFGAKVTLTPPVDRLTDEEGSLRQISVAAHAEGFSANETVSVIFDGAEVQCTSSGADSQGIFSGNFTIPEGIPEGFSSKELKTREAHISTVFRKRKIQSTITCWVRNTRHMCRHLFCRSQELLRAQSFGHIKEQAM